jgi:hypothetical protein
MPLPTVDFNPAKTLVPQKSIAVFTPASNPENPINLVGKVVNYEPTIETIKREVPGGDNMLRPDRIVPIRKSEVFRFELEDVKLLADVFGGSLAGIKKGTVQFFVTDPDDAAEKCSIITNAFACQATLDGGLSLTAAEFAKATILFEATEDVTFSVDGALPSND